MNKLKSSFQHVPWFYILFTFYPLLFLWAANISQMKANVVIRPFVVTLIGSAILYGLLWLAFRNTTRTALIGTLLLVAFFSYGHLYYEARTVPALAILSHHTILAPLYVLVFGLGTWGVFRLKKAEKLFLYLNAIGLVLVAFQVFGLSYAYIQSSYKARQPVQTQSGLTVSTDLKDMPDIYVIVLDGYMRSDALKQDLGYDNSAFIDQLSQMGFYVADCGHPNYTFTYASISALLNMRYIPRAYEMDVWSEFSNSGFWSILQNDEVRAQLKSVGYKMVAFQEEYPLLEFDDSDIVIGTNHPIIGSEYLKPFEVMYEQSTALSIFNAMDPNGKIANYIHKMFASQNQPSVDMSGLRGGQKDFVKFHIVSTLFILDHLTDVPAIAGPKFTYVHIFLPHYPYVFGPNGEILTDPGFYNGDRGSAINDTYENEGYVNQVQYADSRMIPILQTIIAKSQNPPIIILMGDHGLRDNNRLTDLLAYYLPKGYGELYPSISPVNSFRLIFDEYFGGNYPLLPDYTYVDDEETLPADPYPACAP